MSVLAYLTLIVTVFKNSELLWANQYTIVFPSLLIYLEAMYAT